VGRDASMVVESAFIAGTAAALMIGTATASPPVSLLGSGAAAVLAPGKRGIRIEAGKPRPAQDTWKSFARPFMAKYCVACHNDDMAGDSWRNYRMLSAVSTEGPFIACGLAKSETVRNFRGCPASAPLARQLPVGDGPRPTDDERDRFLRWIDSNMP
jgi:hypothetical protein